MTYDFPQWVDAPTKKAQRATNRLLYIVRKIAIERTGSHSMRGFAEIVGLSHSTISKYCKAGAFTEKAACVLEVKLGKDTVTAAMLTNPLDINKPPK